ncbi:hypothetical protein J3E72DRAFT_204759, partial [Bipolaris maydis]
KVVVIALPGTQGIKDWIVNFNSGRHDSRDMIGLPQNLCHGGFLNASRSLVDPLATCLNNYEDRSTLLFTGHSAGAATASLLYTHVLSEVTSRLVTVAKDFTNIHCILFGCPPISIDPLQHHRREDARSSRSLFLSFLNDGDPIIKADIEYIAGKLKKSKSAQSDTFGRGGEDGTRNERLPGLAFAKKRPKRLFVHSGRIILSRVDVNHPSAALFREVANDELDQKAVLSWRVHGISVYKARIESYNVTNDETETRAVPQSNSNSNNHIDNSTTRMPEGNLIAWLLMVIL